MPDVASGFQCPGFPVVVGDFDSIKNPLGGGDLVGSHYKEEFLRG